MKKQFLYFLLYIGFIYSLRSQSICSSVSIKLADGAYPQGTLAKANNGKLYGMTQSGGINNMGVLFEYDPISNSYIKLLDFDGFPKGYYPHGSLILAKNEKLYGMVCFGGKFDNGLIFEFNPTLNTYTKKIDLNYYLTGANPQGSLVESSNGKFYAMTREGGAYDKGVLFEYDPIKDTCIKVIDFDGVKIGSSPWGSLVEHTNSRLYGMTKSGGVNNSGVLFEFDPITKNCVKKIDFDDTLKGSSPYGSLIMANNGKLYGMTSSGGIKNFGVLFEFDPSLNIFYKKLDFDNAINGAGPYSHLFQASNNKFYGMTEGGGVYGFGVLFEYDIQTNLYTKKVDFGGFQSYGYYPIGSFVEYNVGKLYGLAPYGGANFEGTLFEYDFNNSNFTKKLDFDALPATIGINNISINNQVKVFPNPSSAIFNINSDNEEIKKVIFFDSMGNKIEEYNNINAIKYDLKINGPSGVYFVEIEMNDKVQRTKVVKY